MTLHGGCLSAPCGVGGVLGTWPSADWCVVFFSRVSIVEYTDAERASIEVNFYSGLSQLALISGADAKALERCVSLILPHIRLRYQVDFILFFKTLNLCV